MKMKDPEMAHGYPKPSSFGRFIGRMIRLGIFLFLLGLISSGILLVGLYKYFSEDLPQISSLADYRPPIISTVYSDDSRVIAEFFKERRIITPFAEIPNVLVEAFIAAEDSRFFEHEGVDLLSIIRAAIKNFEAGTVVQGGSTITQQVTKSFLLSPEKKFSRKIKEAILAYRIDSAFSKEDILFLYLNQIYLGNGAYGVAAAAENYFGKPVQDLTLAECAMLAGLPQAPSRYSPYKHFHRAKERQRYVLKRMTEEGYINQEEADKAFAEPLKIRTRQNLYLETVPYYTEYIRQYVENKYGKDALYQDGLKIYTAVNIEMQEAARAAVDQGLRDLDKRHFGYRGPIERLSPQAIPDYARKLSKTADTNARDEVIKGVVTEVSTAKGGVFVQTTNGKGRIPFGTMKWALRKTRVKRESQLLSRGDVIWVRPVQGSPPGGERELRLEQSPETQGALLCVEAGTGYVKAIVGGRDFKESQFNRAIQSKRQPGSAFKPIIYAAALDKGYTPASMISDNVFIYKDENMTWKPKNYDKKIYGDNLLRTALAHSRNLSTINLLDRIGVGYVINYAKKLGITSDLSRNLSIALGSSGVSLLELVTAYSVFANQGYRIAPVFITGIKDRYGAELEGLNIDVEQVIDRETAYLMTNLMESVVKEGTGKTVLALNRPAAGKTGTTDNLNDAWFLGYTTDYVSGVWVGYDQERSLGPKETGGKAASPIWLDFMQTIHADRPVKDFEVPEGIVFSKIDADTGLLPSPGSRNVRFECFREGTAPTRYSKKAEVVTEKEDFFKLDM